MNSTLFRLPSLVTLKLEGQTWRLSAVLVIGLALFLVSVYIHNQVAQAPSLLANYASKANHSGLSVEAAEPDSPIANLLNSGLTINAVKGVTQTNWLTIIPEWIVVVPSDFVNYAEKDSYYDYQQQLHAHFADGSIELLLSDQQIVTVSTIHNRNALDVKFYLVSCSGVICYLAGALVWLFRPNEIAPKLFFINSISFYITTYSIATFVTKDMTLLWPLGEFLLNLRMPASLLYYTSLVCIFWHYPLRLARKSIVPVAFGISLAFWLSQYWELINWPFNNDVIYHGPATVFGIIFLLKQWQLTKGKPIERTTIKLFSSFLLTGITISATVYVTPRFIINDPHFNQNYGESLGYLLYIPIHLAFAIGISKALVVRLGRWWEDSWVWQVMSFSVIMGSGLLIHNLNLNPVSAIGLIGLILGFVFYPLRVFLIKHHRKKYNKNNEILIPSLIHQFNQADAINEKYWHEFLRNAFNARNFESLSFNVEKTSIAHDGLSLIVKQVNGLTSVQLDYCEQGERVFMLPDVNLANSLCDMLSLLMQSQQNQEKVRKQEQERIMRDLHDDVAGRLLVLIHKAKEPTQAELAREAFNELRNIIYSLSSEEQCLLTDLLSDLKTELASRLSSAHIELIWQLDDSLGTKELSPRERYNLSRILMESTSNIIRHANASKCLVKVKVIESNCILNILDNGDGINFRELSEGRGMHHIKNRISEINGQAQWFDLATAPSDIKDFQHGTRLQISFPY